jgi:hypothetical protein
MLELLLELHVNLRQVVRDELRRPLEGPGDLRDAHPEGFVTSERQQPPGPHASSGPRSAAEIAAGRPASDRSTASRKVRRFAVALYDADVRPSQQRFTPV